MKMERARELYSDYVEGTLSPAMRLALEQHFDAEPGARDDYDKFARVYALIDHFDAPELEVPLGFRAKVLELAAQEQAKNGRQADAPRSLLDWFRPAPRRWATGGLAALALGALALFTFVPRVIAPSTVKTGSFVSDGGSTTASSRAAHGIITGVEAQASADSDLHYAFHVHLPPTIPSARVTAYVATDAAQIINPATRTSATPALAPPQTLENNEEMQIPVTLAPPTQPGKTLNMFVQWTADDAKQSGAQVVFAPLAGTAPATPAPGSLLDALQQVASVYGVTVIVDADSVPSQTVTAETSAADPLAALKAAASPLGYDVKKVGDKTFHVFPRV